MPNVLFSLRKSLFDLHFWCTSHFAQCCLETITILLARQRSRQVCAENVGYFGHGHFGHGYFGQDISATDISAM